MLKKIRVYILFGLIINLGCYGAKIMNQTNGSISIFFHSDKKYVSNHIGRVDARNILIKAWDNYIVEKTPENNYIVKVYDNDLDILISKITMLDKWLIFKNGEEVQWADNGNKIHEGYYMNGVRTFIWKYYNLKSGYLELEGRYVSGKKSGKWKNYNEEGEPIEDSSLVKGIVHYKKLQDSLYFGRELNCWNSFETTQSFVKHVNLSSPINEDVNANMKRILKECEEIDDFNTSKCTESKVNIWINNIQYKIKEQNLTKTISAIVSIEIDSNGNTKLEIIRGISDAIRKILREEFENMKFEFVRSENVNSINTYIVNI